MQQLAQTVGQMAESQQRLTQDVARIGEFAINGQAGGGGKGGGGEGKKNHEDRLNGKTMRAVDKFKEGEVE